MKRRSRQMDPNLLAIMMMFGLGLTAFATIAFVAGSSSLAGRVFNGIFRRRPVVQ